MKKLIYGGLFITLVAIGISGCKKENKSLAQENKDSTSTTINKKSLDNEDPLAQSFLALNDYIEERNEKTDGEFFEYTLENADYTWYEIDSLGYVDLEYLEELVDKIKLYASDRDESEIFEIAQQVVNPDFMSGIGSQASEPPAARICIFCCTGCMDNKPKNHCIQMIIWTFGPGC